MQSKHDRLIRLSKAEVEEKLTQALFDREQVIKALEEEKADWAATKETIKREVMDQARDGNE